MAGDVGQVGFSRGRKAVRGESLTFCFVAVVLGTVSVLRRRKLRRAGGSTATVLAYLASFHIFLGSRVMSSTA